MCPCYLGPAPLCLETRRAGSLVKFSWKPFLHQDGLQNLTILKGPRTIHNYYTKPELSMSSTQVLLGWIDQGTGNINTAQSSRTFFTIFGAENILCSLWLLPESLPHPVRLRWHSFAVGRSRNVCFSCPSCCFHHFSSCLPGHTVSEGSQVSLLKLLKALRTSGKVSCM